MTYEAKRSKKVSGWTTWSGTRDELIAYLESEGCMDGAMMVEGAERKLLSSGFLKGEVVLRSGLGVRAIPRHPVSFEEKLPEAVSRPALPPFPGQKTLF